MEAFRKGALALSIVFSSFGLGVPQQAKAFSSSGAAAAGAAGAVATSQAARRAEEEKARAAEEAFMNALAKPGISYPQFFEKITGCRFANFDARDLPYVEIAKQEVLGDVNRAATREQVKEIMRSAHDQNIDNVWNNVVSAIADPAKGDAEIRAALNGYSFSMQDNNSFDDVAASYIFDARQEILGDHAGKSASFEEVAKMMNIMSAKAEKTKTLQIGGVIGGVTLAAAAGIAAIRRRYYIY